MTFTDYFGVQKNPFDQANETYFADVHKEDICKLILHDLVDGHNPILLTGESGAGKTLLLRHLSTLLPPAIAIIKPIDSFMNYLERLNMAIELHHKLHPNAKKLLLIVDNAQDVSNGELTSLLNFCFEFKNDDQSLQMIWCGNQVLENKLSEIHSPTFNGLYPNHYRLAGLNVEQVKDYIDACIKNTSSTSGAPREIFSPAAVHEIARLSKGVPRVINQLCNTAMALAFLDRQEQVNGQTAQEAAHYCLFRRDTLRKVGGQPVAITPEDILRASPNKFSLPHIKRLLNFYSVPSLDKLPIKKISIPGQDLLSNISAKTYAGALISGLCLVSLFSYLTSNEQSSSPAYPENPSEFIESLPATSAGNNPDNTAEKIPDNEPSQAAVPVPEKPVMASLATPTSSKVVTEKTLVAEKPASTEKAALEVEPAKTVQPTIAETKVIANTTVATKPVIAEKASPKPDTVKTTQPIPAKDNAVKAKPILKAATNELHNFVRKSNESRVMVKQLIKNEPKQTLNKHAQPPNSQKLAERKAPADSKPKFTLLPLDAPGNFDEIVMVDDPKAPKITAETPVVVIPPEKAVVTEPKSKGRQKEQAEIVILDDPKAVKSSTPTSSSDQIVELPPDEPVATETKGKGRSKPKQKEKFVLKPIDAPGKWDEIVIVNDPKATQKNTVVAPTQIEEKQKTAADGHSSSLLRLDKSSYEFVEQPNNSTTTPKK